MSRTKFDFDITVSKSPGKYSSLTSSSLSASSSGAGFVAPPRVVMSKGFLSCSSTEYDEDVFFNPKRAFTVGDDAALLPQGVKDP